MCQSLKNCQRDFFGAKFKRCQMSNLAQRVPLWPQTLQSLFILISLVGRGTKLVSSLEILHRHFTIALETTLCIL